MIFRVIFLNISLSCGATEDFISICTTAYDTDSSGTHFQQSVIIRSKWRFIQFHLFCIPSHSHFVSSCFQCPSASFDSVASLFLAWRAFACHTTVFRHQGSFGTDLRKDWSQVWISNLSFSDAHDSNGKCARFQWQMRTIPMTNAHVWIRMVDFQKVTSKQMIANR